MKKELNGYTFVIENRENVSFLYDDEKKNMLVIATDIYEVFAVVSFEVDGSVLVQPVWRTAVKIKENEITIVIKNEG